MKQRDVKIATIVIRDGKVVVDKTIDGLAISFDLPCEMVEALTLEAALLSKARAVVRNAWAQIRQRHSDSSKPIDLRPWIDRKCQNVVCGLRIREKFRGIEKAKKTKRAERQSLDQMFKMEHHKVSQAWRTWNRRQCWIIRKCESVVHNMKVRLNLPKVMVATVQETRALWDKQNHECNLTGEVLNQSAECDHKMPVSRGGPSTIENLQWVTPEVHRAKGNMTNEEFVEMCRKVVSHAALRGNFSS
jgi:endonuclease I